MEALEGFHSADSTEEFEAQRSKIYLISCTSNEDTDALGHQRSLFRVCLFVLRFYGPVNPMGSCRARSVYLTTRLLGRLSPLSG